MNSPDKLAIAHPHPRDSHILFDEGPHIYTIDGDDDYMSVTKWNHSHFAPFDSDVIIDKMMASPKWPRSKYFGKTKQEIKQQWNDNGRKASAAGTKLHYDIECFYNGKLPNNDSIEYQYFLKFHKVYGAQLKPYRTEWMVWDRELRFAGSIDMVFEAEDGSLHIYDWKRCRQIKKINPWDSATTPCIQHLPDTNYWHYSLQLNTYKMLLEKNYGKKVSKMYLICLHPENQSKSFERYEVPDLKQEVQDLAALRYKMLHEKLTPVSSQPRL